MWHAETVRCTVWTQRKEYVLTSVCRDFCMELTEAWMEMVAYPAELTFVLLLQCSYQTYILFLCWFLFSDEQWELHLLFATNSFSCLLPCQIYLKEFLVQWKKCYKKAAIYKKHFYESFWRLFLFFLWMNSSFWNVSSFWIGTKSENLYEGI